MRFNELLVLIYSNISTNWYCQWYLGYFGQLLALVSALGSFIFISLSFLSQSIFMLWILLLYKAAPLPWLKMYNFTCSWHTKTRSEASRLSHRVGSMCTTGKIQWWTVFYTEFCKIHRGPVTPMAQGSSAPDKNKSNYSIVEKKIKL